MGSPSTATIKRLFAVSGNCCAFPKCSLQLVDPPTGKVTGRICHIKARQPGGPRYDASQSEEQRHGFDNLLLLCAIHHDVIDDDSESYTVDRLNKVKAQHESNQVRTAEPNEEIAKQFIANISGNTVTHGSIIFSQNQMGGQVAHSIQNFGPQPRQLQQAAANALVAELRRHPAETVDLTCVMGDTEGYQLATALKQVLEHGGWQVNGVNQAIFAGPMTGIFIEVPAVRPSLEILLNWLGATGLKPQGNHNPGVAAVRVVVGANL
jgi:hypothetical protein